MVIGFIHQWLSNGFDILDMMKLADVFLKKENFTCPFTNSPIFIHNLSRKKLFI
jgi:hypothetical protein